MYPCVRVIWIVLASLAALPAQAASPEISVIGSYPGLAGTLGRDAPLYLHLSYTSDAPLRVQAKGYFDGIENRADVRWNPSPAYPAGKGEAMVWIAYGRAAKLDEIRIEVADAGWKPLLVARVPVSVSWQDTPLVEPRQEPEWVARLNAGQQHFETQDDGYGFGMFDPLIPALFAVGLPGYFVLQALFAWRYSGAWWFAALAPLLIMVPAIVHAGVALSMGSNIWPIFLVLTAPFLFLYLCGLAIVRFFVRGSFA